MKFHGIDIQGYMKIRSYDDSQPSYNSGSDDRRLIYVNDTMNGEDALFFGGEQADDWVKVLTTQYAGSIDGYYSSIESDARYLRSSTSAIRDVDDWLQNVIFLEDVSYVHPAATLANVAAMEAGPLDVYDPSVGNFQVVRRDADGNIYAADGVLTAIQAKYADLAEKYTCDELPVGTVVGIDKNSDNEVSQFDFSMLGVIGVVSENPALLMNNLSSGLPIALTGKIKIRVVGGIKKGDCLVPTENGVSKSGDIQDLYKFAYSLETNDDENEKLVMCIIK